MNCGRKLSRIRNEIDDALHEEDNSLKECPIHFLLYYKTEMNRALFILSSLVLFDFIANDIRNFVYYMSIFLKSTVERIG